MIPDDRLQQLIERKDAEEALHWCQEHGYSEGWSIIDGAIVIYDICDGSRWLPSEEERDENGFTEEFVQEHREVLKEEVVQHSLNFWNSRRNQEFERTQGAEA